MKLPFPLRPLADRVLRLRNLQLQRLREPWYTASSCRRYLERDPRIIFDVGANVGDVSIELAQGFPNAQVIAFEPVPHSFKVLQDRAQSYPNLVCHSQAVAASSGRVQMRRGTSWLSWRVQKTCSGTVRFWCWSLGLTMPIIGTVILVN